MKKVNYNDYNVTEFETAFSDFLDRRDYSNAENALFSMVRTSFRAGWLAATESSTQPHKAVHKPVGKMSFDEFLDSDILK